MARKLEVLLVATLTIFTLLPAAIASAAPASTATLTSATTVFPSATDADTSRGDTPFTIRVNNNDSLTQLLTPIDAISITFPPNVSSPSCESITGWTCVALERSGPDALLLKDGMIMAGSNESFSFAGVVSAPSHQDARNNLFVVDVSSDGGRTYGRASGNPTFDVRVFEVGALTVADPNMRLTGGLQDTTATYTWTDHSVNGVTVDPQLVLDNGAGQTARRQDPFTAAGTRATSPGSATFDIVTTEPATSNGQQVVTLRANAGASNVIAEAPATPLTIERSPNVVLSPNTLEINGSSRNVISRAKSDYTVRIGGSKLFPPAVLAEGGFDTTLTLSAPGITPVTLELAGTSATQELVRNHSVPVDFTYRTTKSVSFPRLTESTFLDAEFSFTGTDDNGAPFKRLVTLEDLIKIDVDLPTVTIDDIFTANPARDRVKDGDQITIEGTIASNQSDFDIQLPEGFTLTLSNGAGFSVDNSSGITVDHGSDPTTWTATYTVPETADDETTTLGDLGLVTATVQVRDTAGNNSPTDVGFLDIDNLVPLLSPRGNALGYYFISGGTPKVRVTFDEGGFFGDVVEGGCLPTQWSIPGVNVTEVQYHNEVNCSGPMAGDPDPDVASDRHINDRILVLDRPLDLDSADEIPVNYDAEGPLNIGLTDDVTDQADNIGPSDAASIVDGRIPNIPDISIFERGVAETPETDDYENARSRQGCRNTDASGCDTLTGATNYYTNADIRTALTGGRFATDEIEIVRIDPTQSGDARVTPLRRIDYTEDRFAFSDMVTCAVSAGPSAETAQWPAGAAPCERNDQFFGFRLVREVPRGNSTFDYLFGPVREFIVSYDTVVPTVGSAVAGAGDGDDVLVQFSEDIAAGYDSADDWSIGQTNTDANSGDDDNEFYTRAQNVQPTDNGNERLIGAEPLPGYPVFGAVYEFISDLFNSGALRYEDYAGNFTADGTSLVS